MISVYGRFRSLLLVLVTDRRCAPDECAGPRHHYTPLEYLHYGVYDTDTFSQSFHLHFAYIYFYPLAILLNIPSAVSEKAAALAQRNSHSGAGIRERVSVVDVYSRTAKEPTACATRYLLNLSAGMPACRGIIGIVRNSVCGFVDA